MNNDSDKYIPREYQIPTMQEVFLKLKVKEYSKEGIEAVNKRAYGWLNNAVYYAYTTLNAVINFYPKKDKKYIRPVLQELSLILNEIHGGNISEENIGAVVKALSHAANIFNNTTPSLPRKTLKAVLEARDMCDEAIRQPRFTAPE
jgi:SOS response regulatory protein OraA/RecX